MQKYFKVTNEQECHNGFQYVTGYNKDTAEFNNDSTQACVPGLHFTTQEGIPKYYGYGVWLREVDLPEPDQWQGMLQVVQDPLDAFRANQLTLGRRYSLLIPCTYKRFGLDMSRNPHLEMFKGSVDAKAHPELLKCGGCEYCMQDVQFYKPTNCNEVHNGYQYKTGLNVLGEAFNGSTTEECAYPGFYITTKENLPLMSKNMWWVREVTLPFTDEDFRMVRDPSGTKWRVNKMTLGERSSLLNKSTRTLYNLPSPLPAVVTPPVVASVLPTSILLAQPPMRVVPPPVKQPTPSCNCTLCNCNGCNCYGCRCVKTSGNYVASYGSAVVSSVGDVASGFFNVFFG